MGVARALDKISLYALVFVKGCQVFHLDNITCSC
jgi:hypothetical protein